MSKRSSESSRVRKVLSPAARRTSAATSGARQGPPIHEGLSVLAERAFMPEKARARPRGDDARAIVSHLNHAVAEDAVVADLCRAQASAAVDFTG